MSREQLRALWDAKQAARKAYHAAPSARSIADPDQAIDAEIEERRLLELVVAANRAFEDGLDRYTAAHPVAA